MPSFSGPFASPFGGDYTYSGEGVAKGAVSDSAEDILRKHLNPALKGDAWDAIIAALATGDQDNRDTARAAFDQLFKVSASGIYLTQRAADDGTERPPDLGMSDALFREYAIRTTNNKLTEESLLEVLEIFYGTESVRAFHDAAVVQPYKIEEEDDLIILLDEQVSVIVVFATEDFVDIETASALEVCAVINRTFRLHGLTAYSIPVVDAELGTTTVRIFSGSRGLGSSIRITGGKAQNVFRFSTLLATHDNDPPTWDIVFNPSTDRLRFTPDSFFDVALVHIGDYVTIYGSVFNAANQGTFEVVNTYWAYPDGINLEQWFEVVNRDGVNQAAITQAFMTDLMVFRPVRHTVHTTPERAVVVSSIGRNVDIVLPATSLVVNREATKAAYGVVAEGTLISLTTLERTEGGVVTVDTVDPHGLVAGGQVYIDNVYGAPTIPSTTAGVVAGNGGTSASSKGSIWSALAPAVNAGGYHACAVRLNDGQAFLTGGDTGPNAFDIDTAGDVKIKYENEQITTFAGSRSYAVNVDQDLPDFTTWTQVTKAGDYVLAIQTRGIYSSSSGFGQLRLYVDSVDVGAVGDLGYLAPRDAYAYPLIYVPLTLTAASHGFKLAWEVSAGTFFYDSTATDSPVSRTFQLLATDMETYNNELSTGVGTASYSSASYTDVVDFPDWATPVVPAGDYVVTMRLVGVRGGTATGQFRIVVDGTPPTAEDGWIVFDNFYGGSPMLHVPVTLTNAAHTLKIQYKANSGTMSLVRGGGAARMFTLLDCDMDYDSQLTTGTGQTSYSSAAWTTLSEYPSWTVSGIAVGKYTLMLKMSGVGNTGVGKFRILMDGVQVGSEHHFSAYGGQQGTPHILVPLEMQNTDSHTFTVQLWVDDGTIEVVKTVGAEQYGSRVYYLFKPNGAVTRSAGLVAEDNSQLFRVNTLTELPDTRQEADYDSLTAAVLPAARSFGAMTMGSSVTAAVQSKAIFTGGTATGSSVAANVYAYTPDTNIWAALTSMATARCAHAQTTLDDGKILVTGGTTATASAVAIATCERYTPSTNLWAAAAAMNDARAQHEQVKLPDGRVMVIGGRDLVTGDLLYDSSIFVGNVHATCEIYDPVGDTWTKTGRMAIARFQHSATVLPDGRVLVVGGIGFNPTQPTDDPQPIRDAEIWNPTTGAWQPAGRTAFERETPLVAYLASKKQVVVTGGSDSLTTEFFDPAKARWKLGSATMPSLRVGAKAVLLEDDLVWVGGGIDAGTEAVGTVLALYLPNADGFLGGGLNGIFRVTEVTDANTFKFETPNETQYTLNASTEGSVTPIAAPSEDDD